VFCGEIMAVYCSYTEYLNPFCCQNTELFGVAVHKSRAPGRPDD
jgi:hypothetical protein